MEIFKDSCGIFTPSFTLLPKILLQFTATPRPAAQVFPF
jgi:hypothetical protein